MSKLIKTTVIAACVALAAALSLSTMTASTNATVAFQSAKSLYASKCAVCHGNDGSANTAKGKELKVRSLKSEEFKKMTDAKAMEIMMKGKGKMEGYEKTLGKEKLQMLLAYCRELAAK